MKFEMLVYKGQIHNIVRRVAIFAFAALSRLLGRGNEDRVIALHDTPDQIAFRHKMEWLKDHYEICNLDAICNNRKFGSKQRVAITFDDGYENWYTVACPILIELSIPATFFVNSGLVGLNGINAKKYIKHNLLRAQEIELISERSLIELSRNTLFEVGGHTCNHPNLATLKKEEVVAEVEKDKELLEGITSTSLRWFAYPFGGFDHINSNAKNIVASSGYEAAFSIVSGPCEFNPNRFMINRICLDISDNDSTWKNCLAGGLDYISYIRRVGHHYK